MGDLGAALLAGQRDADDGDRAVRKRIGRSVGNVGAARSRAADARRRRESSESAPKKRTHVSQLYPVRRLIGRPEAKHAVRHGANAVHAAMARLTLTRRLSEDGSRFWVDDAYAGLPRNASRIASAMPSIASLALFGLRCRTTREARSRQSRRLRSARGSRPGYCCARSARRPAPRPRQASGRRSCRCYKRSGRRYRAGRASGWQSPVHQPELV